MSKKKSLFGSFAMLTAGAVAGAALAVAPVTAHAADNNKEKTTVSEKSCSGENGCSGEKDCSGEHDCGGEKGCSSEESGE